MTHLQVTSYHNDIILTTLLQSNMWQVIDIDVACRGGETTCPMRILTRYVLIELAKVFLVSLAGLTMLMIVVGIVREAAMQSLPLGQVVWLIPYILPDALRVAVPVTLLLATTSVYGRMSGANEVVAIKAMGISPMVVIRPTIIVAILLSLVTVWLNDLAVSWGRNGARRVVVEAVEEIAYAMLKANRSYSTASFSIHVRAVEGKRLIRPTLTINSGDRGGPMTVTAEEAEITADHAQRLLRIRLRNFEGDAKKYAFYVHDTEEYVIPLDDASRAQSEGTVAPSWLALWQIPQRENEQRKKLLDTEQEMAARAAYQMLCGDFEIGRAHV